MTIACALEHPSVVGWGHPDVTLTVAAARTTCGLCFSPDLYPELSPRRAPARRALRLDVHQPPGSPPSSVSPDSSLFLFGFSWLCEWLILIWRYKAASTFHPPTSGIPPFPVFSQCCISFCLHLPVSFSILIGTLPYYSGPDS